MNGDPVRRDLRMRWWHGLLFFFIAVSAQILILVFIFVGRLLGLLGGTAEEINAIIFSPAAISLQILFTSCVLVFLAVAIPKLLKVPPSRWLRTDRARPAVFVAAIVGVAGVGFLADEAIFLLYSGAPDFFDSSGLEIFNKVFANASLLGYIVLTLVVMVGPGLGEELFFRGFVLRSFRADMSAFSAVLFSSILFGLMHFDPLQSPGATLIGLYLGFVALKTGSVWPGVAAHAFNNLLCALFARFGSQSTAEAWNEGHPPVVLIAAAVVVAGAVYALTRLTRKE